MLSTEEGPEWAQEHNQCQGLDAYLPTSITGDFSLL